MGLSLSVYIEELHQRSDLIWPIPPEPVALKATPYLKPLTDIRLVTWSIYGTLLHVGHGRLLHQHPQEIRMQIALEKTISEFNMWYSMTRRQGQPWEGLKILYDRFYQDLEMVSSKHKGDYPEVDSSKIWMKIIEKLQLKEYSYDVDKYGDEAHLAMKIAYFFHANLQGARAVANSRETLAALTLAGIRQGLLSDAQVFSVPQLGFHLQEQLPFVSMAEVLAADFFFLSSQEKVRKPSISLYQHARDAIKKHGISPDQVLHVSHRLQDDLAVAKKFGFRTALFAADKSSCDITPEDVRDPALRPDRLITEIRQIRDIVQV